MKKKLIVLVMLIFLAKGWGQEKEIIELARKDLAEQRELFKAKKVSFDKENSILLELTKKLDPKLSEQYLKVLNIKKELDTIYNRRNVFKEYYLSKKVPDSIINNKFPEETNYAFLGETDTKSEETKVYYYFGKNKVIDEKDNIFKDKNFDFILKDALEAKSESYLGDFTIPKKGQEINFETVYRKVKGILNKTRTQSESQLKFHNIKIHLYEGSLYDIKLIVTDENNKEYLFENRVPISLLRYSKLNHKRYLYCNPIELKNTTKKISDSTIILKKYRIKLSDVLTYVSNPGNNYVPEDETLEFPTIKNDVEINAHNSVKYKVQSNTSLQNIVELRSYTDFLGLFDETSPNGIVQLEGKADFYIAPFNVPHSTIYLFKKITPFVSFSKINEKVRNVALTEPIAPEITRTIKTPLQLLEKSYLQMGVNLNVCSFKITKDYPFCFNFYGVARYQISDIMIPNITTIDSTRYNYKSLGLGGGLALEFKRYNNFGFIYSSEFTNYNTKSLNVIDNFENPGDFMVFKNEAEVYYFPGETKSQSIFLRLKTFSNMTKDNDEAFYQLQFGYRFSIGVSKLKQ